MLHAGQLCQGVFTVCVCVCSLCQLPKLMLVDIVKGFLLCVYVSYPSSCWPTLSRGLCCVVCSPLSVYLVSWFVLAKGLCCMCVCVPLCQLPQLVLVDFVEGFVLYVCVFPFISYTNLCWPTVSRDLCCFLCSLSSVTPACAGRLCRGVCAVCVCVLLCQLPQLMLADFVKGFVLHVCVCYPLCHRLC